MQKSIDECCTFEVEIKKAVNALLQKDYITAQKHIKNAMIENCHAPEVQNLLGILAELTGDSILACKHFRAAYALDPTYEPANRNLERIVFYYGKIKNAGPDFGCNTESEELLPSIIK